MSRIDPELNKLLQEEVEKINLRIRKLLIYFQEHEPILADDSKETVELKNKICLALYASNCQLDMAIMYLKSDW